MVSLFEKSVNNGDDNRGYDNLYPVQKRLEYVTYLPAMMIVMASPFSQSRSASSDPFFNEASISQCETSSVSAFICRQMNSSALYQIRHVFDVVSPVYVLPCVACTTPS